MREDWEEEDEDDLEATQEACQTFKRLIEAGHGVDVMSLWSGAQKADVTTIAVSLREVRPETFRFVENYRFRLTIRTMTCGEVTLTD